MDYDRFSNLHNGLRLSTGREISLDKLIQSRTYSGLLSGVPDTKFNDRTIENLVQQVRQDSRGRDPYLVVPERQSYFREPGDVEALAELMEPGMRVPEWLPKVHCVGEFMCMAPARDSAKDGSCLWIVWYQNDFGFEKAAIERLRLVDWERFAWDFEY
jgi:hypothetical protein